MKLTIQSDANFALDSVLISNIEKSSVICCGDSLIKTAEQILVRHVHFTKAFIKIHIKTVTIRKKYDNWLCSSLLSEFLVIVEVSTLGQVTFRRIVHWEIIIEKNTVTVGIVFLYTFSLSQYKITTQFNSLKKPIRISKLVKFPHSEKTSVIFYFILSIL